MPTHLPTRLKAGRTPIIFLVFAGLLVASLLFNIVYPIPASVDAAILTAP